MERIYVFIYRDKADGRINAINIIAEGVTKMLLEDIQKHNADSRNKSIVEWMDCCTLLDVENLLRKIRTHEDAAFEEAPKQQTTVETGTQ